jgi:hypothetical protein
LSLIFSDRLPIVEEVVATLTSAAGAGYGGAAALRAGMRRATDQFDEHARSTASRSYTKAGASPTSSRRRVSSNARTASAS